MVSQQNSPSRGDAPCRSCGIVNVTYNGMRFNHDEEACVKRTPQAVTGVAFAGLKGRHVLYEELGHAGAVFTHQAMVREVSGVQVEILQLSVNPVWIHRDRIVQVLPDRAMLFDVERFLGSDDPAR